MRSFLKPIAQRICRVWSDREGSVATTFALAIIPMIGLLGAATDFATVASTKSKVQAIADAAVLSAVSETTVRPTLTWQQQKAESEKMAKATFEALMSAAGFTGASASATYEVTLDGTVVSTKVCFSGQQKTMAVAVAGFAAMDFSGCATASSAPPLYVSVYVLADASGSMGIGASTADQTLMNQKLGCAVRRQNIWRRSRRKLSEFGPRLRVDIKRRVCGVASADARWSVA